MADDLRQVRVIGFGLRVAWRDLVAARVARPAQLSLSELISGYGESLAGTAVRDQECR